MEGVPNALTAGPDGWLYGTTVGATVLAPAGQMYRVHPTTGVLEVVYTWPANGANGSRPRGRLLSVLPRAGYDLALVGVTEDWGDYTCGVVYRLDVLNGTGTLTKLHDFTCGFGGRPDNGMSPQAGLVQHTNGLLYGTTGEGAGRIYRIGPEGGFAAVYNLGLTGHGDPVVSEAPMLLGADGHLYGTTSYNSAGPPPTLAGGSIFRLRFGAASEPTALDDQITTAEDTPTSGTLVAENPGGRPLRFSLVTNGSLGGTVVNATTGAFTYTPNANAGGADSFTFKVNDGTIDSNIATVSVTITPVNDAPVALDDILAAVEDTVAQGAFPATDVDGPSLTFSIVANGSKGTAAINNPATGAFTYTPNANANGTDTVTFKVTDGSMMSNTATVAITIDAWNDAPIAQNGKKSVFAGSSATGSLTASDIDSAALTYSIVVNGGTGTAVVTNAATGAYTYTASAGASGTDTFTFKANDGTTDSNLARIAVTILTNRPLVANSGTLTTAEDKSAKGILTASDPDGKPLTFRIVSNGSKGTATITEPASGRFKYAPAPNANGSDSFTFVASDGTIDSDVATVSVTIAPVNDAPIAGSASYVISRNTTASAVLVGTDIDSSTLTYAIVKQPRKGSLDLNAGTGAFTYTPPAGFAGVESFTYRVWDGEVTSATATISITVK
jgi:VCBS repeat-containing protein